MAKIKKFSQSLGHWALTHPFLALTLVSLFSTAILYFPFVFHLNSFFGLNYAEKFNFSTILLNFDSLNYIIVAKTWYDPQKINAFFPNTLPPSYFPAHFPAYPALIWLFSRLPKVDFPHAAIIATQVTSLMAIFAFYKLLLLVSKNKKTSLLLSSLFAFFPARWLVVKNIPSPEPLFLFFIISAAYFFKKENYGKSAFMAILSQTVKSPGVLLAGALGLTALIKTLKSSSFLKDKAKAKEAFKKFWPILLTPLGIISVFFLYQITTGDFWAYFKTGDNIHLFWPPFQVFDFKEEWVGTIWLEDVYLYYLLGGILLFSLWQKYKNDVLFIFPAIFYLSLIFVSHRDIARYMIPALPFLLLGGENFFQKKQFLIPFIILLPPLFLYAINFVSFNIMPLADWAPYL
ncbi:hypothetical protein KBI33_00870 [Candidatus Shapirobacteria bacterium]|nr:hypothetical protein [Candidatus Shapirobacteria bacterium]